jgi:surface-anchored protein
MKLTSLLTIGLALPVSAATLYTGGHMDGPAFGYVSEAEYALDNSLTQGFEPHLHNEGGADGAIIDGVRVTDDSEYEPGDVTIVVPELSTTTLNSQNYYWLSQDETDAVNNGAPFLGVGLEELNPLDWVGGSVNISLASITGPGSVSIWQDGFEPVIFFDSAGDSVPFAAGSHTHLNWGFTAPGAYQLEFAISGTHEDDGFQSASGTYNFQVVPEPSAAVLGALGALAMLRRRR